MYLLLGITLIIVILVTWYVLHRFKTRRIRKHGEDVTVGIVEKCLDEVEQVEPNWLTQSQLNVRVIGNIWGQKILVYEFSFPVEKELSLPRATEIWNAALEKIAKTEKIKPFDSRYPSFVVSDAWYREENFHLDIAYVADKQTVEYLDDMHLLSRHN